MEGQNYYYYVRENVWYANPAKGSIEINAMTVRNCFVPIEGKRCACGDCHDKLREKIKDDQRSGGNYSVTVSLLCEDPFIQAQYSEFGKGDRGSIKELFRKLELQPCNNYFWVLANCHEMTSSASVFNENYRSPLDLDPSYSI